MSDNFQRAVIQYYRLSGRSFFWREESLDMFEWLLVEMLLKRTRSSTVDNHGKEVVEYLKDPEDVVTMSKEELVDFLKPFGLYNRRSKNLKNVCRVIVDEHGGTVPEDRETLRAINGIGEYIADAIVCFGCNKPVLALDTNTALVAREFFGIEPADDLRLDEEIRPTLEPLVPTQQPKEFNWGLLDMGSELRQKGREAFGDIPDPEV